MIRAAFFEGTAPNSIHDKVNKLVDSRKRYGGTGVVSNARDRQLQVEVKAGKVKTEEGAKMNVEWIRASTDGSKRIVSIEDKMGGKVVLDDGSLFKNPARSIRDSLDVSVDMCGDFDAILRLCILCQDRCEVLTHS